MRHQHCDGKMREDKMSLEGEFDEAMHNIYVSAVREARYTPHEFHRMLAERGGLATARDLINRKKPSDGCTNLYLRGFLRLTVEAVILMILSGTLYSRRRS